MSTAAESTEPATPMRKGERTRLAMLQTAIEILDELGPEALTLQALGDRLHLHRTAVYRHFRDRDDLLAETLDYLISQMAEELELPDEPRARIAAIAMGMRRMFHRYPGASSVFVMSGGARNSALETERIVLAALRDLGVAERELPYAYQALESYAVGASLFDFASAPRHLESRLERHRSVRDRAMDRVAKTTEQVDKTNESAFLWGLEALLMRIYKA